MDQSLKMRLIHIPFRFIQHSTSKWLGVIRIILKLTVGIGWKLWKQTPQTTILFKLVWFQVLEISTAPNFQEKLFWQHYIHTSTQSHLGNMIGYHPMPYTMITIHMMSTFQNHDEEDLWPTIKRRVNENHYVSFQSSCCRNFKADAHVQDCNATTGLPVRKITDLCS